MADGCREWLSQIGRVEKIDTLVWLGAGKGSDLAAARAVRARRIVLVEPNPAHLPALRKLAAEHPQISVLPVAIDERDGSAELRLFNWSALSGLRALDGLTSLFPGARQVGTCEVRTMTLASLLSEIDLEPGGTHLLRVDAPGIEAVVAAALRQQSAISHVIVRSPNVALYENGIGAAKVRVTLQGGDWRWRGIDTSDADFVDQWLWHDPAPAEIRSLHAELDAALQEADRSKQKYLLADADLGDLRERLRRMDPTRIGDAQSPADTAPPDA